MPQSPLAQWGQRPHSNSKGLLRIRKHRREGWVCHDTSRHSRACRLCAWRNKAESQLEDGGESGDTGGRAGIKEETDRLTGNRETEGRTRGTASKAVCGSLWFSKQTLELVLPCEAIIGVCMSLM